MAAVNAPAQPRSPLASVQFPFTVFLSAFLLFWTQLILGKFILPWFGGTPGVWTTCMLFFQLLLLAGYVYAHIVTTRLDIRRQAWLHCVLLLLSLMLLAYLAANWNSPITPGDRWKPPSEADPVLRILSVLAIAVGLPYFALSTTGPLLQAWHRRTFPVESPYRLYAISNFGSFLALFTFPLVLEPRLPLPVQGWLWALGYTLFVLGCCVCSFCAATSKQELLEPLGNSVEPEHLTAPGNPPDASSFFLWFALAATASILFLATTNLLCQDVAVVPLLWILPLGIYLLTFILCFEHSRWYARNWFHAALPLAIGAATFLLYNGALGSITIQILLYLAVLFVLCMICHGELARSTPPARNLTVFYLAVAAGGASGGIFVGLLAPRLFTSFLEYPFGLFAAAALLLLILTRDTGSWLYRTAAPMPVLLLAAAALLPESVVLAVSSPTRRVSDHFSLAVAAILFLLVFVNRNRAAPERARKKAAPVCAIAAAAVLAAVLVGSASSHGNGAIARFRNFYGTLSLIRRDGDSRNAGLSLVHGRVVHGFQLHAAEYRRIPTTYYSIGSGLDRAFRLAAATASSTRQVGLQVGAVGLGAGTVAAYGRDGDSISFYEINPQVIVVASNPAYFTFLSDSAAKIRIVPGDARVSLEREAAQGGQQDFDLLVLDAFSGDSVPVHLLTREAFAVYLRRLSRPAGILAIHITNTYLDLRPVVLAAARHYGLNAVWIHAAGDRRVSADSDWMLLSYGKLPPSGDLSSVRAVNLWTDEYSNLLQILGR